MEKYTKGVIILITLILLLNSTVLFAEGDQQETEEQKQGIRVVNLHIKSINGNNMIELRELGQKMGWSFDYDKTGNSVIISNQGRRVKLGIGQSVFYGYNLELPPIIIKGRTYIDLKLISILLGELNRGEMDMIQLLADLEVNKTEVKPGGIILAEIKLANISEKEIPLKYASGKLYDLYLLQDGKKVWRWSANKFFTMALIKKELEPGKELNYEEEILIPEDLEAGEYTLTGDIEIENPISLPEIEIKIN